MNLKRMMLIAGMSCACALRSYGQEPDTLKEAAMEQTLENVVVKATMPLVKAKEGRLVYTISKISKGSTALNAFEVLKEVPGITGMDDRIELAGAQALKIVLNGKISSMTLEQLIQLLKSMPATRVEQVEVLYQAPAKYNFNGSVINVVLGNAAGTPSGFMGESGGEYVQYKYPTGKLYTNLLYSKGGWNVDFLADFSGGKWYRGEDMYARHTYGEEVIPIEQSARRISRTYGGTGRLGVEYLFPDKSRLSGSYYVRLGKSNGEDEAVTGFGTPPVEQFSTIRTDGRSGLHNVSLQYQREGGFTLGGDYTYFDGRDHLHYSNRMGEGEPLVLDNPSSQRVSQGEVYVNHKSGAGNWMLEYGVTGTYNGADNTGEYYYSSGEGDKVERMEQREYNAMAFVEAGRSFGEKFSMKVGLKGEYFYARNSNAGTLWDKFTGYPTLSLNYLPSNNHVFQFHVGSNRTYPGYWDLSTRKVPLNAYSYAVGNPTLRPYRTYTAQLVYVLKSKYVFVGFYHYSPDYFVQLPYQKEDELATVFETVNFDFKQNMGLSAIIPFKVGRFWDSKVTVTGVRMHEKNEHFHNLSFNRSALFGMVEMLNTFRIPSVKALSFTLHAKFTTPGAIQGLYDLGYTYPISAAVKYTFANEQAAFTLAVNDIFKGALPNKIEIDRLGQYSTMRKINETQCVKIGFSYKFGGYRKKEYKEVDRSRF